MAVALGRDRRDALGACVVDGALRGLDDQLLLALLGRRVRRVGRAVVEPRVDVERHVHDVDAVVARVGQRVEGRAEEEVARVLAGAQVDEVDLGGDAADALAVERRADGRGDVRAVAVLVDVGRVLTRLVGLLRAGPSTVGSSTVKLRDSAASKFGAMSGCEPSMPVSMMPTRTACEPCWHAVGAVGGRAHHAHVPLLVGERLAGGGRAPCASWPPSRCACRRTRASRSRRGGPCAESLGAWPMASLTAAPSSAPCSPAFCWKSAASVRTVATPIAAFSETILPPASATASWAAARSAPCL